MSNEITASVISDFIPALKAQAMLSAKKLANVRNYVTEFTMENGSLVIPKIANLSASTWSEAQTLVNAATTITNATITSGKMGIQLVLAKEAISRAKSGNTDLLLTYGTAVGNALANAIETSLVALFAGFSQGVGTTSSDKLTFSKLATGIATIYKGDGVGKPTLVASPLTYDDLMQDAAATYNFPGLVEGLGCDIATSNAMTVASDCATSAVFVPTAIALGVEAEPQIRIDYDFKTDTNYLTGTCLYGVAELYDAHGYHFTVHA